MLQFYLLPFLRRRPQLRHRDNFTLTWKDVRAESRTLNNEFK
jgi:hypothetical protein